MDPATGIAAGGLGLSLFDRLFGGKSGDEKRLDSANSAAAIAQAEAVKQNEARKSELYNMFSGGFDNAGNAWEGMSSVKGVAPGDEDWFASLQRAAMTRGMMGIVQPSGTGLAQSMGSQSFLEGQQSGQDLSASAEALADSILAKYGQGQDGSYTSPGYQGGAPQLSDGIGFIDEPQNKYTPAPFGDFGSLG